MEKEGMAMLTNASTFWSNKGKVLWKAHSKCPTFSLLQKEPTRTLSQ